MERVSGASRKNLIYQIMQAYRSGHNEACRVRRTKFDGIASTRASNRLDGASRKNLIYHIMQAYRSGHNEAVLKTVWVKAHGGSNPSACAIQPKLGEI